MPPLGPPDVLDLLVEVVHIVVCLLHQVKVVSVDVLLCGAACIRLCPAERIEATVGNYPLFLSEPREGVGLLVDVTDFAVYGLVVIASQL
jgi:hypothetical protein